MSTLRTNWSGQKWTRSMLPKQLAHVLTGDGSHPEEYALLVDAVIYAWNPRHHFQRLRITSNQLEQECIACLRSSNRVFESLDHAKAAVIAEKWQNWKKLLEPYDDDAYTPEGG